MSFEVSRSVLNHYYYSIKNAYVFIWVNERICMAIQSKLTKTTLKQRCQSCERNSLPKSVRD